MNRIQCQIENRKRKVARKPNRIQIKKVLVSNVQENDKQITEYNNRIKFLESDVSTLKTEMGNLEYEKLFLQEKVSQLQEINDQLREKILDLEQQISELEEVDDKLTEMNKDLLDDASDKRMVAKTIKEELDTLKRTLTRDKTVKTGVRVKRVVPGINPVRRTVSQVSFNPRVGGISPRISELSKPKTYLNARN